MGVNAILGLIDVGLGLVKQIKGIVDDTSTVLKSDDQTLVKGKLSELLSEVRSLSDRTGQRLRGED
jgi:hypothetical protein